MSVQNPPIIVYGVYRNADMTEGSGPMVLHCVFKSWEEAAKFIDYRPGIMGRQEKWSEMKYGDWKIEPITVYTFASDVEQVDQEEIRKKALNKLSNKEKKALGLV